jgi:hypothetical protein
MAQENEKYILLMCLRIILHPFPLHCVKRGKNRCTLIDRDIQETGALMWRKMAAYVLV